MQIDFGEVDVNATRFAEHVREHVHPNMRDDLHYLRVIEPGISDFLELSGRHITLMLHQSPGELNRDGCLCIMTRSCTVGRDFLVRQSRSASDRGVRGYAVLAAILLPHCQRDALPRVWIEHALRRDGQVPQGL